jgi:hypothetical protein
MPRPVPLLVLALALGLPALAAAQAVDWSRYADVDTVEVLTRDADGEARVTTVWLLVQDGEAFLRTGSTTWGGNVERHPDIALRIGAEEVPVRAEFVRDPATRERVARGFREKYGFWDRLAGLVRFGDTKILRLTPR